MLPFLVVADFALKAKALSEEYPAPLPKSQTLRGGKHESEHALPNRIAFIHGEPLSLHTKCPSLGPQEDMCWTRALNPKP